MAGGLDEVEAVREIDLGRDEALEEGLVDSETVGRRRILGASC